MPQTSNRQEARKLMTRAARGVTTGVLGALLLATPATYAFADQAPEVRSASSTQMSSKEEVVYVNTLNDPAARIQNFNENWKFNLGDAKGAEAPEFDDSSWKHVDLPHDYSIDQKYTKQGEAESGYKLGGIGWYRKSFMVGPEMAGKNIRVDFDGVYMDSTVWINGHKLGGHPNGYTQFSFDLTKYIKPGEENTLVVKVNHETPSSRWYSGSGIGRDVNLVVTDPLHVAKDGVVVTTPELGENNKTNVKTKLAVTVSNAGDKDAQVELTARVFPRNGSVDQAIGSTTVAAQTLAKGTSKTIDAELMAANPKLWSTDDPNLYTVRCELKVDGKIVDTYDVEFGYRFFSFDANKGFSLNGKPTKIKGVCLHHDQGALGSVSDRAAIERQVKIMKDMGANSIRTSHNAPSRELIEVCNEQGMLIDEEFFDGWTSPKNGNGKDYARFFNQKMGKTELVGGEENKTWAQFDLEQGIARDINDPSVIMWSLGNEMSEGTSGVPNFKSVQKNLIDWAKAADPTRPVTTGDNRFKGNGNAELNPQGIADANGVVGFNYMQGSREDQKDYDEVHKEHPTWKIIGSETASAINSRGVYDRLNGGGQTADQQLTSYDNSKVGWGHFASEAWYDTITRDFVAGEYVWTGFDYLGEPTPWNGTDPGAKGPWPSSKNSYFGIVDTAGLPKDSYYFYQSQWNDQVGTLHMLPAWNENVVKKDNQGKVPVVVYTDAPEVELFFTPKDSNTPQTLGKKKFTEVTTGAGFTYQVNKGDGKDNADHKNLYLTWMVPYKEGTITAKAYGKNGEVLDTSKWDGRQSVTTTGPAKKLQASASKSVVTADGDDLSYVTIDVCDQNGNIVPDAKDMVTVKVQNGELAGMDNGSSPDHQSFRDDNRKAHAGQLVAIVRSGKNAGPITVTASAKGLADSTVTIDAKAAPGATDGKQVDSFFYSRYQYVKLGSPLTLPQTAEVRYTDGTREQQPVRWESVSQDALSRVGSFKVSGKVLGMPVTMNVTVLDEVAALLNYSTTVQVGSDTVALPDARPAVLADGTVLNASFPVTWEKPAKDAFKKAGVVVLKGTSNVFGKDVELPATIRVQNEQITIGDNVAPAASLSQDIPQGHTSDTLKAITDGKTDHKYVSGGDNSSCWSNWKYSQEGHKSASITLTYATQQRLGEAKIFFFEDASSARFPDPHTVKFQVSEDGSKWTDVAVTEKIGEAMGEGKRVKPYTYSFAPVTATYVKITVTNKDVQLGGNTKPCTGITEVQLKTASGSTTVNATAALSSLTVNGQKVSNAALAAGEFSTRALTAEIEAVPADNAAMTVLPAHENKIKILLESEDHAKSSVFTINLAADHDSNDALAANDDSRDYPVEKMTKNTAGSEHKPATDGEGPVELAFDKKTETKFHSHWDGGKQEDMWVQMELPEPATIEALRYLPRQDSSDNGTVTEYRVQYSDNGKDWQEAAKGTWKRDKDWKIAQFTKPVTAKFFRFEAPEAYADNHKVLMSAAEIRLRQPRETIDIADESKVKVEVPAKVTVNRLSEQYPVGPNELDEKLASGDKTLVYGVDYLMTFANNTKPGTATVTIEGIGNYSGTVERTFTIELKPELAGVAVKPESVKTTYKAGDKLDFTGLVLNATMTDDSTFEVAYNAETKGDFSFDPAEGTELKGNQTLDVTVTYKGKTATFTVSVAASEVPNPPAGPDGNGGGNGGNTGNNGEDHGGNNTGNGSQTTPQGGEQSKPAKPTKPSKHNGTLVQTGDNAVFMIGGIAVAAIVLVAVGVLVRRRK